MLQDNKKTPKHLIIGLGIIILIIIGLYAYYRHIQIYPSTDNAYVNANSVNAAPKVGGYIERIYVQNNQFVHKGDLLLEINPQDYKLQLTKSKQDYMVAKQQSLTALTQIANAKSNIAKAKADYDFARQMAIRYANLYKKNAGSLQDKEKYENQAAEAKQALEQANTQLEQAQTQYEVAKTQIDIANTNIDNAKNNTGYTQLRSTVDGYVTDLNLQSGEFVSPGQKLFGLVDNSNWWVDVNFKETQLKRIRKGQEAKIKLDMYDHEYKGIVQSISYASGNTFSLLPAQNATGNWVKVTQRFTVRVKIENDPNYPLRVGASSEVTIDTTDK